MLCTNNRSKFIFLVFVVVLVMMGMALHYLDKEKNQLNTNTDMLELKIKQYKLKQTRCTNRTKPVNRDAQNVQNMRRNLLQKSTVIENQYQNLLRNESATQQRLSEANTFSNDVMKMVEVSENSPDQEYTALKSIFQLHRSHRDHLDLHETYKGTLKGMHDAEPKIMEILQENLAREKKMEYLRGAIQEGRKKLVAKERMVERANRTNFRLNGTVGKLNEKWSHMWGHVVPPLHPFTA